MAKATPKEPTMVLEDVADSDAIDPQTEPSLLEEKQDWRDTYRGQYKVMHVGVGAPDSERMKVYASLQNLATAMNVKESTLVWHAIYDLLDNPPTDIREDVIQTTGSASGFWLVVSADDQGRAKDTSTVEVEARHEVRDGQTFFRYEPGDEKSRLRAEKQVLKAEIQLRKLLGLSVKSSQNG